MWVAPSCSSLLRGEDLCIAQWKQSLSVFISGGDWTSRDICCQTDNTNLCQLGLASLA